MIFFSKIQLFWNTVRYLKPIQIYWRFWLRFYKPKIDLSPASQQRQSTGDHLFFPKKKSSFKPPNTFTFLSETYSIQSTTDWNNLEWGKLWLYNLHYFDDLNACDADYKKNEHRVLIAQWVRENKPALGNGWEPYPLSLRIVNWIKWRIQGNALEPDWEHCLAIQVRHLRNQLEYHLLGNHLFANAKALVIAGLFFEGNEASTWLKKGLKILDEELPEQILDDGGHFELSPMYHLVILEDILDLINVSLHYEGVIQSHIVEYWIGLAGKMLHWLRVMIHPDGGIALFNDAAFGIASQPAELFAYAQRLEINTDNIEAGSQLLPSSGYARLENEVTVVLADVGQIGPDYLPGHAHADTLSFELSLFEQRVIVDSGTSCYGYSNERLRQRSTNAHNTVEVERENSSEVWGGFRVARRAYPIDRHFASSKNMVELSASHNGYQRLNKNVFHHRQWQITSNRFTLQDYVSGSIKEAFGRFLFSPDVDVVEGESENSWLITLSKGQVITLQLNCIQSELAQSTYHPEFGKSIETKCLHYSVNKNKTVISSFSW